MSKTVNLVVKGYFYGALALSASHVISSFEKLGLTDGEQYLSPFAIDGIAVLGLVLRGAKWSTDTRKMGLRLQVGAGSLSLAANVFAGSSIGGRVLGVMTVALFLVAEAVSGKMETREAEQAKIDAKIEEARLAAEAEAEAQAREVKNAAARARRQASKTAKHSAEVAETRRIKAAERALQASK